METTELKKDITVFCVVADSFPAGIQAAHEQLHRIVASSPRRRFYGLSRPEQGGAIVYRAAAEELTEGEGRRLGCDTLVIKKGRYIALTVPDHTKDPMAIKSAFDRLLQHKDLDPQGYCVEQYAGTGNEVRCMVRLADT